MSKAKIGTAVATVVVGVAVTSAARIPSAFQTPQTSGYFPTRDVWERRAPVDVGMNEARLNAAIAYAQSQDLAGERDFAAQRDQPGQLGPLPLTRAGVNGIVLRHGFIVAEFGDTAHVDPSYSVAKSYLSTLLGVAVDRGLVKSVTERVAEYVSDGGYATPHNASITWEHHVRQTSEWAGELFGKPASPSCTTADGAAIEAEPGTPGSVFEYNDVRVNRFALSLLRVWKRPLADVLKTEVMDPIGASDTWRYVGYDNSIVDVDGRTMTSVPGGSRWGGGLWMSTRDHARFGLLMLRNGNWNGRQVLSSSWIQQAITPASNGGQRNYGYMWWLNSGGLWPELPRSSFAARGDGPNVIWIDPEHDLVVVWRWFRNSDTEFLKRILAALEPPVALSGPDTAGLVAPAGWPEVLTVGAELPAGGRVALPARSATTAPFVPPAGTQLRGNVVLEALVAPDGSVHDVRVVRAPLPPDIALNEAAVQTMKKWTFAPTVIDDVARPVLMKYSLSLDRFRCAS
ncbi:MAG TPA: TonB family protein [Vicinamibacterales bacterium]|nr:TonB family protein [Vicinamibacterales bacterium]